jgi:hypothetical protein
MWILAVLLLARADDAGVLVADFTSLDGGSAALAGILPGAVESKLATVEGFTVVPLDRVGPIHDTTAEMYLASCPPGQDAGCAFVVAEVAGAEYAIAGTVAETAEGTSVEVSIVDVLASEEVIRFEIILAAGDEALFAERVAEILVRILRGEIGRHRDLRWLLSREELAQAEAERRELFAKLSRDVDREMAGVSVVTRAPRRSIRVTDVARSLGRQGQVLLRPTVGYARGPVMGAYDARYAREAGPDGFTVAESYAYQATASGGGAEVGAAIAYGVLPTLDVGVEAGLAFGRYSVEIGAETVGEAAGQTRPEEYPNRTFFVGPAVSFVPFPDWSVRPSIGGSIAWWRGTAVDDHVTPPAETGAFGPPSMFVASIVPGAEVPLSRSVDFIVRVPFTSVVAGRGAKTRHTGGGVFAEIPEPPALAPLGVGVVVGLQVRLFGADRVKRG